MSNVVIAKGAFAGKTGVAVPSRAIGPVDARTFLVVVTLDDGSGFMELPLDATASLQPTPAKPTTAQTAQALADVRRTGTEAAVNRFLCAVERHYGTEHMVAAHKLAGELAERRHAAERELEAAALSAAERRMQIEQAQFAAWYDARTK
jgi:hypothetical protein